MRRLLALAAAFLCAAASAQAPRPEPIETGPGIAVARTTTGQVQGFRQGPVQVFRGIPYARAQRFMAPQPAAPWQGVRRTLAYGKVCPVGDPEPAFEELRFIAQHTWGEQDEDCLNLNVWAPAAPAATPRPVMVWFHGGAFSVGSSRESATYDGGALAARGDVVVVTVNHRLNVLGFLDLSDHGPGFADAANAGLLDLVAALRWVRANAAAFGGDAGNVTIFGESGGAAKAYALMSAPAAKGLFHKAILQSNYRSSFLPRDTSRRVAGAVLAKLGLDASRASELRRLPYSRLKAAADAAMRDLDRALRAEGAYRDPLPFSWMPTIDGRFLPWQLGHPEAVALSAQVPVIVGSTLNEFALAQRPRELRGATPAVVEAFLRDRHGERWPEVLAAFRAAYPEAAPADLLDLDTDFRAAALEIARRRAQAGAAPTYVYLFTWASPVLGGFFKSSHAMDLAFTFDNVHRAVEATGGSEAAYRLAGRMAGAWARFAHTGRPAAPGWPDWPAFSGPGGATMRLDDAAHVQQAHDHRLMDLLRTPSPRP
ncbi:carboxylesterase/lipase family protein [Ramlibacter sp. MAHUQ-53]|uniref:carboxylesterase/lipase family protein n=1 Tax=unclassified Ramlibacter TaxID=2617605 RepID=UPI0036356740